MALKHTDWLAPEFSNFSRNWRHKQTWHWAGCQRHDAGPSDHTGERQCPLCSNRRRTSQTSRRPEKRCPWSSSLIASVSCPVSLFLCSSAPAFPRISEWSAQVTPSWTFPRPGLRLSLRVSGHPLHELGISAALGARLSTLASTLLLNLLLIKSRVDHTHTHTHTHCNGMG